MYLKISVFRVIANLLCKVFFFFVLVRLAGANRASEPARQEGPTYLHVRGITAELDFFFYTFLFLRFTRGGKQGNQGN